MKKVVFYFDGFNFYHGFKSHTKSKPDWRNYYWIDFVKFCSHFIASHDGQELHKVKYFTAPPITASKKSKQSALFAANKIINGDKFEVINGHYSDKFIVCKAACKMEFKAPEEKCTDVNLALHILQDCIDEQVDIVVIITADSDQLSTIKLVRSKFPKIKVRLYFPPDRKSNELRSLVSPVTFLENHEDKFRDSMMPTIVTSATKRYTKPESWKK